MQRYIASGNFGVEDQTRLTYTADEANTLVVDNANPQGTIASVSVSAGTWLLQAGWSGVVSAGTGQASSFQAYAISTAQSIPGYSGSFADAVHAGDVASPVNGFTPLQGGMAVMKTVATTTTFYLYGGPSSITSTLSCAVSGYLRAIKVSDAYV